MNKAVYFQNLDILSLCLLPIYCDQLKIRSVSTKSFWGTMILN
jgi:hypothetical protein